MKQRLLRRLTAGVAMLAGTAMLSLPAGAASENLIPDKILNMETVFNTRGDMDWERLEKDALGDCWYTWVQDDERDFATIGVDAETTYEGKPSIKAYSGRNGSTVVAGNSFIYFDILVEPGTYEAGFYYKTEDFWGAGNNDDGIELTIDFFTASAKMDTKWTETTGRIGTIEKSALVTNKEAANAQSLDWTNLSRNITVTGDEAQILRFGYGSQGCGGTVWFSGFYLTEAEEETPTTTPPTEAPVTEPPAESSTPTEAETSDVSQPADESSDSSDSASPAPTTPVEEQDGPNVGLIVGLVIAGVVVVGGAVAGIIIWRKRKHG